MFDKKAIYMVKKRLSRWYNYLLSGILWLLGFGMMGCTDSEAESPMYGVIVEYGPPPGEFAIDENFKATLSYLQGEWAAQYEGWDYIQECNTTIRRKLELNPNGTYTNIIAGKLPKEGNNRFLKFESEMGTYTYNQTSAIITYTCRYDSILVFRDQSYAVYNKKHYYNHEDSTYTEKVLFTVERNGKRGWIAYDTFLGSNSDNAHRIAYWMSRYDVDYEP